MGNLQHQGIFVKKIQKSSRANQTTKLIKKCDKPLIRLAQEIKRIPDNWDPAQYNEKVPTIATLIFHVYL